MKFNVPQFIDIEDKIAFQLTAKQLGWFALGGVLAFFAWTIFSQGSFIVWAIIIAILSLGFAFYRPAGISLVSFLKYGFLHLVRPKIYVWRIEYNKRENGGEPRKTGKKSIITGRKKKKEDIEDLDEIIDFMDSRGL